MKHDTTHNTLVTMCDLGDAYHIQIWSLPELSLMHQVFTAHDLTDFIRLVRITHLNYHPIKLVFFILE